MLKFLLVLLQLGLGPQEVHVPGQDVLILDLALGDEVREDGP